MSFEEWLKQGREYAQGVKELPDHELNSIMWLAHDLVRLTVEERTWRDKA